MLWIRYVFIAHLLQNVLNFRCGLIEKTFGIYFGGLTFSQHRVAEYWICVEIKKHIFNTEINTLLHIYCGFVAPKMTVQPHQEIMGTPVGQFLPSCNRVDGNRQEAFVKIHFLL